MRNEPEFHPLPQNEHDVKFGNELENAFNINNDEAKSKLTISDFCEWNCWIEFIDFTWWAKKFLEFLYSGTHHAKKSYFIIICSQILLNLCGTLVIVGFITDIFKETGSILSEKDSSILIAVVQLIANLVFLSIVEQFNRRVCIIRR